MIDRLISLSRPAAIAHRGGSRLRPENTLAAFDHAVALGVDGLECDVHLSRDGVPVVIHDATLDRTTDQTGPVSARSADELARVDAGYRFQDAGRHPYRGAGIGVPRLADLLRRHPDIPMVIELKGDRPAIVPLVLEVIRAEGAAGRVLVGGFSHAVLDALRRAAPDLPTSASRLEVQAALRRAWFGLAPKRPAFALVQAPHRFRGRRILGRRFVHALRRARLPVHAWIVDEPGDMRRLLAWGVTGLISDRPDLAVEAREAMR